MNGEAPEAPDISRGVGETINSASASENEPHYAELRIQSNEPYQRRIVIHARIPSQIMNTESVSIMRAVETLGAFSVSQESLWVAA